MKVIVVNGSESIVSNIPVTRDMDYEMMCEFISQYIDENSVLCVYNLESEVK